MLQSRLRRFTPSITKPLFALGAGLLFACGFTVAHGANLQFDATTGTAGAQDGTGTWSSGGPNWRNTDTSTDNVNFTNGDAVTFGAGSGAAGTVTISGTVTTTSITFNATGSGTYTITGGTLSMTNGTITQNVNATINSVLAGSNFTKNGTGTLTLGGNTSNTFTGSFNVNAGTLVLNKAPNSDSQLPQAINNNVTVNVGNGTAQAILQLGRSHQISDTGTVLNFTGSGATAGIFRLNGFSDTVGAIRSAGDAGIIENNHASNAATLTVNNTGSETFTGIIRNGAAASLNLTKANTGLLRLTGLNSYTGTTTVRNGALEVTGMGSLTSTANVVLAAGGTLKISSTSNPGGGDAIANTATITLRGGQLLLAEDGVTTNGTYGETLGATTAASGASTFTTTMTGSASSKLTLASLSRNRGATLNFNSTNLGVQTNRIVITTAPSGDHGLIGGWATVGNDFAKYSSTSGVTALTAADYVTSGEADWTFEANARITGNTTLTAARRVNSLNIAATGATTVDLGSGTLRVESGGILVSGSSPVTIGNGTLTGGTGPGSAGEVIIHQNATAMLDITATITDNGPHATALVKSGIGDARLSAANTFTGGVFVNSGFLVLNHASAITAANKLTVEGGTLDLNGNNLTVASLTSSDSNTGGLITNMNAAGGTKTLTAGADNSSSSYSGQFGANLNFTKTGTGTFTLNQGNASYAGIITVAQGTLATGSAAALGAGTSASDRTIVQTGATLDISNGINRNERLEVSGHGVNGLGAIVANSGDSQNILNMTLTGHTTLGVNVRYDFDNALAGNGHALTKIGGGELALEGAAVLNLGDVHVKQGTVTWSGSADLGVSSSTLYVDQGATAQFFNKASDIKRVTLGGGTLRRAGNSATTNTLDVDGGLRLTAGASSIASGGSALTFQLNTIQRDLGATLNVDTASGLATTDSLNDAGGILGGYVTFGVNDWARNSSNGADGVIAAYSGYANNDFTAATNNVNVSGAQSMADATVNSLRFGSTATTLNLTGTNTIASGGILIASGGGVTISGGSLRGAAGRDLVIIQNNATTASTISSKIEDNTSATALTKAGAGVLTLSGNNTYTGGTFIVGGTLVVTRIADTGDSNLGNSASATENILTFNGGTLSMQNTTTDQVTARNVVVLSGGGTIEVTNASRTLELSGVISGEALLTGEGTYALNSSFTKAGSGRVTFSGTEANTYTGLTTITAGTLNLAKTETVTSIAGNIRLNGGTLMLSSNHQIANTSVITYTNGTSTFVLNGHAETIGGLSSTSGGAVRNNLTGTQGRLTTDVAAGVTHTYAGVLEDGTGGTLFYTKRGAGTQILTGSNIYNGDTVIEEGTLQVGNGGNSGTVGSPISNVILSGGGLVINRSDNLTFSNAMSGTGTFTVAGTGGVTINSVGNTYAGNTDVRSGTLYVTNASGSATGTSAVQVYGTGKLGGTGSIAGPVTVRDGGQITPGNTAGGGAVGTLTFTSDLTVNRQAAHTVPSIVFQLGGSGATVYNDAAGIAANMGDLAAYYSTKLNDYENETGEHDRVLIGGTLNLDAGATIALDDALGYQLKAGDVLDLMDWASVNLLNAPGDRAWSAQQDLMLPTLSSGLSYDLSLFGSNGIVVVVAPEPGRAMLLMVGMTSLVLRRRRRA